MSLNLDIIDVLKKHKGRIRTDLYVAAAGSARSLTPPKGTIWILIGGILGHITGTNTYFFVRSNPSPQVTLALADARAMSFFMFISDADATTIVPIFNNLAELYMPAFQPVFITDQDRIWFSGAATAYMHPIVLEIVL